MRDIFRRYPNKYEHVIGTLCDNLDTLDNSEAKAAMIWIIGEYAERIDNGLYSLSHSLTHTHSLSLARARSLSLTHTHTQSHTNTRARAHTHTHRQNLSTISVAHPCSVYKHIKKA